MHKANIVQSNVQIVCSAMPWQQQQQRQLQQPQQTAVNIFKLFTLYAP